MNNEYKRIVILGDPHLPGRLIEKKTKVISSINSWKDVDLVVSIGDVCATYGTKTEYKFAKEFFNKLSAPFITLIGNHDNYYSDNGYYKASDTERLTKIKRFKDTFTNQKLYFSKEFGNLRLYFLAVDGIENKYYSAMSNAQLRWFEDELNNYSDKVSVVFCHAPLWSEDVIKLFPPAVNYIVQPAKIMKKIILKNKQIKLWASGHAHFGMIKGLVEHPFNNYENIVNNIVNTDMDGFSVLSMKISPEYHEQIWTRSLFIYNDKIICKTYDHNAGCFMDKIEIEYPI